MRLVLPPRLPLAVAGAAVALATVGGRPAGAQPTHDHGAPPAIEVGAQGIGIVSRVSPALLGRTMTEGYLTQPMVMARARALRGTLAAHLTVDFEGATLERGELTPGAHGEGYVDRRHPHTYLHEAIASVGGRWLGTDVSIAGGKGFAPFGSDDPMVRPFVKYPVNHHLAQVLERAIVVVAVRRGWLGLEGATFNGDEPESATDAPNARRFGDSWSVRATVTPVAGVEGAASYASVASPEAAEGWGLDHRKWSAYLRVTPARAPLGIRYLFAEWARTDDYSGSRRAFRFSSFLAEGAARRGAAAVALRLERTTRPEEERLLDRFRTSRPHSEFNILGVTRWDVATAHAAVDVVGGARVGVAPFAEVAVSRPVDVVRPSVFVPRDFYGASRLWTLSAGVRLRAGHAHGRMGRYGAAVPSEARSAEH